MPLTTQIIHRKGEWTFYYIKIMTEHGSPSISNLRMFIRSLWKQHSRLLYHYISLFAPPASSNYQIRRAYIELSYLTCSRNHWSTLKLMVLRLWKLQQMSPNTWPRFQLRLLILGLRLCGMNASFSAGIFKCLVAQCLQQTPSDPCFLLLYYRDIWRC